MFKKTILALPLLAMSAMASAELTTPTQSAYFSGTAGNTSLQEGLDPFTFDKFDSSLGTLTGVFVRYDFTIDNGLIGADNMTNEEVSGTGELGGSLTLTSELGFVNSTYNPVFEKMDLLQTAAFTLAADPTQSVGGNGPDVATLYGVQMYSDSGWVSLGSGTFNPFVGTAGDTFDVDFDTDSSVVVNVPGAQGFFQAVDTSISMELYYTYEAPAVNEPPASAVSVPAGLAAAGMFLMGAGALRRRSK